MIVEKSGFASSTFRYIAALFLIAWLVLPLVPLALWSFAHGWFYPDLLPTNWTLKAWKYALSDTAGVLDSLLLSMWISFVATMLSIVVGFPAGRALGMYRFRGKAIVELLILAPMIVPGIAISLGLHSVFISIGLNNTVGGVILVHLVPTLPYMIFVMSGVFSNYDPEFEAQARTLGASPLQVFYYVTLPTIMPGLVVGGLFAFLVSWSQYILTLIIGGGRVVTLPLLLYNFATAGRNDITGAIGMIYIVPGVLVLLLSSRFLSGRSASTGGFVRV
ncbi:MAG: ABC transporter permease [Granulosicoccus sp.]